MHKLIICTLGTSIANGISSLRELQSKRLFYDTDIKDFEKELHQKIKKIDLKNQKDIRALSAELNTLDRLKLGNGDRVILLTTDNALGRVCGVAVKEILERIYKVSVEARRVEGLQVQDEKLLKEKGLKNFIKVIVDDYLANDNVKYNYDIILNPTGGFKGILPFLTILGMIYAKPSIYLFEFSDELIHLPPLPITFDINIYNRVKDALKYLEDEVAITKEAFLSKIDGYDQLEEQLFLSFTEPYEANLVTLSPLAYVFLQLDNNSTKVLIESKAYEKLQTIKGEKRIIIERMIENSANPLWRQQHIHRWNKSDFLIMKTGNTSERIAGFIKNGEYHIALIFPNHDEYEKELLKYSIEDFNNKTFTPWQAEILTEAGDVSSYDKLLQEYDLLTAYSHSLEAQNKIMKDQEFDLKYVKDKLTATKKQLSAVQEELNDDRKLKETLQFRLEKINSMSFMQKVKFLLFKNSH